MGLLAVGIAVTASTFSTDGSAQAKDLFVHIKSAKDLDKLNPYYGGIPSFQLDKKNTALIGNLFPHGVATSDEGLYVLRDQDPDHIKCMSENGLAPLLQIRDLMKDPLAAIVGDFEIKPMVGCNERWHRKIIDALTKKDAKIEEIKLEAQDQNTRDQVTQIVQMLKGLKVDIEDPEGPIGALKSQMNAIAASNTELINILKTQQRAADKADKIREQKAKIEAGAQFTDMLGKIVFANNPEAAYKVSVATKGLSSIAQNIVDISHAEKIGQQLLSGLSATNAALSMISMFSAFGEDPLPR
ncbi:hypothetical protein NKI88_28285 [Mesorhizobium sp. M0317]|uniref:hypothetical protein n=1 Tax=Mesorhizobium sp. M0317 TaxID=2956935 RepID=UPI00333DAF98